MAVSPAAMFCLVIGTAQLVWRLGLSARVLRYEAWVGSAAGLSMATFRSGALCWVTGGAPRRCHRRRWAGSDDDRAGHRVAGGVPGAPPGTCRARGEVAVEPFLRARDPANPAGRTQAGVRWNSTRRPTSGWIPGVIWIADAPVPTSARHWHEETSQRAPKILWRAAPLRSLPPAMPGSAPRPAESAPTAFCPLKQDERHHDEGQHDGREHVVGHPGIFSIPAA